VTLPPIQFFEAFDEGIFGPAWLAQCNANPPCPDPVQCRIALQVNSLPLPLTILAPFGTDEEALPYAELIATQLADDGSFTGLSNSGYR
jgi:hypothetical protein